MKKFIYKNKKVVIIISLVLFILFIIVLKIIINKDNNDTIVQEDNEWCFSYRDKQDHLHLGQFPTYEKALKVAQDDIDFYG